MHLNNLPLNKQCVGAHDAWTLALMYYAEKVEDTVYRFNDDFNKKELVQAENEETNFIGNIIQGDWNISRSFICC